MRKILTGSLIALQLATTQPIFASEKVDEVISNGKKILVTAIEENPISEDLELKENEIIKTIIIKPRKKKIKFPSKKKSLNNGAIEEKSIIGAVIEGESLVVPMEFVEKGEDVVVPAKSVKKGEEIIASSKSIKKGEDVIVHKEAIKEGETVNIPIELVKEGIKVVVSVDDVKEGEQVMVYMESVKKGTIVTVPIEFVKEGEDIEVPIESIKDGEDIVVSVEAIKKGEKVVATIESIKEGEQVGIPVKTKEETINPETLIRNTKIMKYSHYKNAEQIFDLSETYKRNIETNYANNKIFFWSFFLSIIKSENINEKFIELLKNITDIDNTQIEQIKNLVIDEFGTEIYEKIYTYLFYISLNQIWEEGNALYNANANDGYRVLTSDMSDILLVRGFEFPIEEIPREAFTFQKNGENIEIISISGNKISIIGELSISNIENLELNFYHVLDFILESIKHLPTTPLKDIVGEEQKNLDSLKNTNIVTPEEVIKDNEIK